VGNLVYGINKHLLRRLQLYRLHFVSQRDKGGLRCHNRRVASKCRRDTIVCHEHAGVMLWLRKHQFTVWPHL